MNGPGRPGRDAEPRGRQPIAALTLRAAAFLAAFAVTVAAGPAPALAQVQPAPPTPPPLIATPSPAPSALPTPSASPSGFPQASPSALPGVPIRVDHVRVGVVPGGTVTVGVGGGAGPLSAQSSFDGVLIRYDGVTHTLFLTGRSTGRGTVTLSDTAGDTATVDVLVAPAAGAVPPDVSVQLAGTVTPQFAANRIRAAIVQQAQLQPGAILTVAGVTIPALRSGDVLDAQAAVRINGNNTFVDEAGTTNVHLRVAALPQLEPVVLFYSDDPERLGQLDDGVLFRGTVDASRPARVYAYHVSDSPGRKLFLALQTQGASGSTVQVLGALAGPSDAFAYVGHLSTLRYLLERATQESFVTPLAPGAAYVIPLPDTAMLPGQLTAAIQDLRVLSGDPVNVSVVSASNGTDPASLLGQPEHADDGHQRRGEFALTSVPPFALAFTTGAAEPPPMVVGVRYVQDGPQKGQPVFPNLRPGGAPLAGDYGVVRAVQLQLANPSPAAQNVYLYEQPGSGGLGGVTTTIWFAGDAAPTEVRCVSDAQRYLVKQFTLAASESRTVTGTYMTDGTSWFPLSFGLTATPPPPAPQNACGAKPAATTGLR